MRVTERAIFESGKVAAAEARERHAAAVDKASTGLAMEHPWDSADAARVAREKIAVAQAGAIATVAERSSEELNAVDGALASVVDTLTSAAELAVQMANGTYNAEDRLRAAAQARAQWTNALAALNVEVAGRYLLGGTEDQAQPFDPVTGTYQGDDGVRTIEAGPGMSIEVSLRADQFIVGASGGVDVLGALDRFADALEADDVAAIRASLGELQTGIAQVARGRSQVGSMQLSAEAAALTSREVELAATERKAALTDADFVDAATELALAERALDATLSVTAKSFQLSLLDRL